MIRILTDTASDITPAQAAKMGVELVTIGVHFASTAYDQPADEDFGQFYELLESEKNLPTTSQPAPGDFLPHFTAAKQAGDSLVAILLAGGLSGTVQSAHVAKEMAEYDDIYIIDSKQAAMGQRLLVDYALRLRDSGALAPDIAAVVQSAAPRVRLFAAIDTLKYLRKGGRIPKTAELLGSALGIKPLIELRDGAIEMAGKTRGRAGAVTGLMKLMAENDNFDPAMPVYFAYTQNDIPCRNFRKLAVQKFRLKNSTVWPVGPTIGTHIGPGGFAAAWLVKE